MWSPRPRTPAEPAAEDAEVGGHRQPAAQEVRHRERLDPPEAQPAAHRHRGDRPQPERRAGGAVAHETPDPTPALAGDVRGEEAQREHRGDLPRGAEPDEQRAQHPRAAHPDLETREDDAEHDRVVVDAADQVEEHQRADREPERRDRLDAGAAREVRHRPDDEAQRGEREHAVQVDAEHDVVARDPRDEAPEGEEAGPVRRRRRPPDRRDARDERIGEPEGLGGAVDVGVEPARDDLGLGEVAVDVGGEQRRRDGQRHHPHDEDPRQLAHRQAHAPRPREPPEPQPGEDEHAHADVGERQRDRRHAPPQAEHARAQQGVVGGGGRRPAAEGADGHEQRARGAEPAHGAQPAPLVGRRRGRNGARRGDGRGHLGRRLRGLRRPGHATGRYRAPRTTPSASPDAAVRAGVRVGNPA